MLCGTEAVSPAQHQSLHCLLFAGLTGVTCPSGYITGVAACQALTTLCISKTATMLCVAEGMQLKQWKGQRIAGRCPLQPC